MTSWICPKCGRAIPEARGVCAFCSAGGPILNAEIVDAEIVEEDESQWFLRGHYGKSLDKFKPRVAVTVQEPTAGVASLRLVEPESRELVRPLVIPKPARAEAEPSLFVEWPPRHSFPTWITQAVVGIVVILAVASSLHRFLSPDGESTDVVRSTTRSAASIPASPAEQFTAEDEPEYPFARFVEVTGLRVVQVENRSQAQYLVVNHSSEPLTNIGLRIAVKSAASADGSPALFTVSSRVPFLGPHESKEIHMNLDSSITPEKVPEWVNLRTEAKVISER